MEDNSIWKLCIKSKYGTKEGGWFSSLPRGSHGVGLWKTIAKESYQLKKARVFILRDGRKIRFWKDSWCGSQPLCVAFPVLYSIAANKGAKAADLWVRLGGGGAWDPKLLRSFNDWELDAILDSLAG